MPEEGRREWHSLMMCRACDDAHSRADLRGVASALAAAQKVAKVGAAGRHKGKVAVGAEEKWLRSHLRHLQEVKDGYDVIMYGDDIVEAWRCAPHLRA